VRDRHRAGGDGDDLVDVGDGDNIVLGDLGVVVVGSLMATTDPGFGGDDVIRDRCRGRHRARR
jgi:hypothetical protein